MEGHEIWLRSVKVMENSKKLNMLMSVISCVKKKYSKFLPGNVSEVSNGKFIGDIGNKDLFEN